MTPSTIGDPRFAPRRDDLPFLRRRRRPRASTTAAAAAPAPPPAAPISFARPERGGAGAAAPPPPAPAAPPAAAPISFDRPGRRPAAPAAPAAAPPPPAAAAPPPPPRPPAAPAAPRTPAARAPAARAPVSSSLDLDEAPPRPPAPSPAPAGGPPAAPSPAEPPARVGQDTRVAAGGRLILTVAQPTVTLTRLQSAIGTLSFEAACSPAVGDLRLGCAYELADGYSSTVQLIDGHRFAPPDGRRPLIVAAREHFDRLAVDLRQSRTLTRLAVYAFSASRSPLQWGGTLVVTTFGNAKVEVPLEHLQGGNVALLMSLYNIRGEFVLRAEMQSFYGGVRDAVRAYGYDRITWVDDRTPVE